MHGAASCDDAAALASRVGARPPGGVAGDRGSGGTGARSVPHLVQPVRLVVEPACFPLGELRHLADLGELILAGELGLDRVSGFVRRDPDDEVR